ncbi:MAG: hypothetical protein HYW07_08330 [Candidatus Latescibacteria bacterium]|nr:hypothetical protein [Candidatus Latescibacterota bacterium]
MQICHPLVPVVTLHAAQIGPGHQRPCCSHPEFRLEDKGFVADIIGGWAPLVDEEDGDRAGTLGDNTLTEDSITHWYHGDHHLQAPAIQHFFFDRLGGLLGQIEGHLDYL